MSTYSNFGSRFAAAASALALSLVLITGTVTMPAHATAQTAYVGQIA